MLSDIEISNDEYDCNLALYLNLPEYFHNPGKMIPKKFYFKLKKSLENIPNTKKRLVHYVSFVLDSINNHDLHVKEILVIYIYVFLDTQPAIDLLLCNIKFKTTVMKKFTDIIEYQNTNPQFLEYMLSNFTTNKRFLSIKKNSQYRKRIFRIYMKTLVICHKWYNYTLEKRYSPEGNGAIEAKNNFIFLFKIYSKKIN